jgi:hypothetical protein
MAQESRMRDLDQSQGSSVDRPRRGWLARNWIWLVPTTLVGLGLFWCGACLGIYAAVFGVLKSSAPYQMALDRVQNEPRLIRRLGEPIEDAGWFPTGEVNAEDDRGDARLDLDVAGPKGKAHVHAEARRITGHWGLTRVEVIAEGGQRIVLDVSRDEEAGGEAPLFRPEAGHLPPP